MKICIEFHIEAKKKNFTKLQEVFKLLQIYFHISGFVES